MRTLAAFLVALLLPSQAFAWGHGVSAFSGPGSPGFLGSCSGTFSTTNEILQSNNFGTTWTLSGAVVSAPSITATNAIDPNGGVTATTINIPTVTGANAVSALRQSLTNEAATFWYTNDVWVQNTTPANGQVWVSTFQGAGASFNEIAVPNDGAWHHVVLYPSPHYTTTPSIEIGVDLRDGAQSASTGTMVVNVWRAQGTGNYGLFPYIDTTTAPVTATQTIPCPAGIAFRDFTNLTPWPGNPINTQNAGEAYQAGGVSQPFVPGYTVAGKIYGIANSTDTNNHNNWCNFSLYSAPSATPLVWTEETAHNPIMTIPGSNCPAGTLGTGPSLNQYALHPTPAPNGCVVSAVTYTYCWYFSAKNTTGSSSGVYLMYSNTVTGPYTIYNAGDGSEVLAHNATNASNPSLGSLVQVGNTDYMYVSRSINSGLYTNVFTSPASDGLTWTYAETAMPPSVTGDWDATNLTGFIDNQVRANGCGFYEYYYTALWSVGRGANNVKQAIGYMVAADPRGPWFKYQGPIIPYTSSLYSGTIFLGDPTVMTAGSTFYWTGNFDNGSNLSSGMAATMPDFCVH